MESSGGRVYQGRIMPLYQVGLIRQTRVARGTSLFEFTKPARFLFRAGQAVDVVLPQKSATQKMSQTFSLVSAPSEKTLMVAMRMRESAFKKKIGKLRVGDRVAIEGPFGSFGLDNDAKTSAVFIAGGIGITPFISMLRETFSLFRKAKPSEKIFLFYSNRTEAETAFLEELRGYAGRHNNFIFVPIFSALSGRINKKILKKEIGK